MTDGMALVKQECANLVSSECIGMSTKGRLWRDRGKCYIAEGKKCQYYDAVLKPLILKQKVRKRRR